MYTKYAKHQECHLNIVEIYQIQLSFFSIEYTLIGINAYYCDVTLHIVLIKHFALTKPTSSVLLQHSNYPHSSYCSVFETCSDTYNNEHHRGN